MPQKMYHGQSNGPNFNPQRRRRGGWGDNRGGKWTASNQGNKWDEENYSPDRKRNQQGVRRRNQSGNREITEKKSNPRRLQKKNFGGSTQEKPRKETFSHRGSHNSPNSYNSGQSRYSKLRQAPEDQPKQQRTPPHQKENQVLRILLKYSCLSCGRYNKSSLHPSKFLLSCRKCNCYSHLNSVRSNFRLLYGSYRCQDRRCGNEWMTKLPFRNIILNTPICSHCDRLTKISVLIYKKTRISFKNSSLFKCEKCYRCRTLAGYQKDSRNSASNKQMRSGEREGSDVKGCSSGGTPTNSATPTMANPICENCGVAMHFLKNMRSVFSSFVSTWERKDKRGHQERTARGCMARYPVSQGNWGNQTERPRLRHPKKVADSQKRSFSGQGRQLHQKKNMRSSNKFSPDFSPKKEDLKEVQQNPEEVNESSTPHLIEDN